MSLLNKVVKNERQRLFIQTSMNRFKSAEIGPSAAAIAYYLLLSLFPLLIAIGNMLPYLNMDPDKILPYIESMVPPNIFSMLKGTIRSLLSSSSGGLLSVSAIATLWASSRSINALQNSLNKVFGVERRANMFLTRIFSFGVISLFMLTVMILAVVFSFGQAVLDYILPLLNVSNSVVLDITDLFGTLKWPVTVAMLFLTMCLIYSALPNARVSWRSVVPGAILTTIGWMVLTQFFGLYTKYFSSSLVSYGIIGGFVVFMLWLDFAATLILLGGVINAICEEFIHGTIETRQSKFQKVMLKWRKKTNKKQKD